MMNKKLLLCAAIASSLFLAACVKKEAPTEAQSDEVEVSTEVTSEPAMEFTPLEPVDQAATAATESIPTEDYSITEAPITESHSTTQPNNPNTTAAPAAEAAKAQDTPTQYVPKDKSSTQSQDDAVADAIAAATPALEN